MSTVCKRIVLQHKSLKCIIMYNTRVLMYNVGVYMHDHVVKCSVTTPTHTQIMYTNNFKDTCG